MAEINTVSEPMPPAVWATTYDPATNKLKFLVTYEGCWALERMFPPSGPWHEILTGSGSTAVSVENPTSEAWYRVVARECPEEVEDPQPQPVEQ
jgi:hypothetical protein